MNENDQPIVNNSNELMVEDDDEGKTLENGIDKQMTDRGESEPSSSSNNETKDVDSTQRLVMERIEKLNLENHDLRSENNENRSKIVQLEKLCSDLKLKLNRSSVSVERTKRELQSMVIKYATSEKDVINCKKQFSESDRKCKELLKERDTLQVKLKDMQNEKKQLISNLERKVVETATLTNDNELLKNRLAQAEIKIEQSQLTAADLSLKYNDARERLTQIEHGLSQASQHIDYDDDNKKENIKFKLCDDEVDDNGERKPTPEPISDDQQGTNWTAQYLHCIEHNRRLLHELEETNSELASFKEQTEQLDQKLTQAHEQMKDYSRKTELIEMLKNELINKQTAIDTLKEKFDQINDINRDLLNDAKSSKHKEGELLEYTERLTAKLVSLQSEHNILCEKLKSTEEQCQQLREQYVVIDSTNSTIKTEYEDYKVVKETEIEQLRNELQSKETIINELKCKIDELENDIKIVKRKHISSLKELNKEIQLLKRVQANNVEQQTQQTIAKQNPQQPNTETNSTLSSRTSSFTSLCDLNQNGESKSEYINNNDRPSPPPPPPPQISQINNSSESSNSSSTSELITSSNDIDKNMLIERILRLQRNLIKRNEKIDFLEEHNEQLTEEVKKKSRLLQYYILKEDSGALATESMDKNKVS